MPDPPDGTLVPFTENLIRHLRTIIIACERSVPRLLDRILIPVDVLDHILVPVDAREEPLPSDK